MLPPSLLSLVESHGCFSGCYGSRADIQVTVQPNQPAERTLHVQCEDCLSFEVGVLAQHLPGGMYASQLAAVLTDHMRVLRGYAWTIGGYHGGPANLWLSAAYYPCGVVLISGDRNSQHRTDLDCLIAGFQRGVITASDPAMLAPSSYRTQAVYLDMSTPVAPVRNAGDIVSSQQCSTTYKPGHRKVTIAEFLPALRASPAAPPAATPPSSTIPGPPSTPAATPQRLLAGERCPKCGAQVKERPSLTETFIGCKC